MAALSRSRQGEAAAVSGGGLDRKLAATGPNPGDPGNCTCAYCGDTGPAPEAVYQDAVPGPRHPATATQAMPIGVGAGSPLRLSPRGCPGGIAAPAGRSRRVRSSRPPAS